MIKNLYMLWSAMYIFIVYIVVIDKKCINIDILKQSAWVSLVIIIFLYGLSKGIDNLVDTFINDKKP